MDVESMEEVESQFPHQRGGMVEHGSNSSTKVGEKGEGFSGVLCDAGDAEALSPSTPPNSDIFLDRYYSQHIEKPHRIPPRAPEGSTC